jgi:tRNA threonylcarbamoyladenosine biosynthesis protein TsaB
MMLFLDTSDPERTSLFLIDKKIVSSKIWPSKKDQSEKLHSEIQKFLKKSKIPLQNLNKIGVVVGPGHFSRVRTGVVTANTLAYALNIPIVGVKKLGTGINFSSLIKQKGTKAVAVYYAKAPNITKAKTK